MSHRLSHSVAANPDWLPDMSGRLKEITAPTLITWAATTASSRSTAACACCGACPTRRCTSSAAAGTGRNGSTRSASTGWCWISSPSQQSEQGASLRPRQRRWRGQARCPASRHRESARRGGIAPALPLARPAPQAIKRRQRRSCGLARRRRRMTHGLDAVAGGVDQEGGVVIAVVVRPQAGLAVRAAAGRQPGPKKASTCAREGALKHQCRLLSPTSPEP